MRFDVIKNERLQDEYIKAVHDSGLNIYIYPQKEAASTYAIFGTDYGSINTRFRADKQDDFVEVPAGIAHYLEHKLFESEDGDAFSKYAKTGASANAYTSFNMTCYLFSCTENFKESLEILLGFVTSPYFTEQTVNKEQGIIAQEIKMYDDDPHWKTMFNLLQALYHNHPVRVDIAGTVDSIKEITPEKLYRCYNCFYNLNNMAICIAGNVDVEETLKIIEANLKTQKPVNPETIFPDEPEEVLKQRVEQRFEISMPMFQLGFKEKASRKRCSTKEIALTEILLDIMASKISPLYQELIEKKLINASSFSYEYFEGPGYASIIFAGESKDPDKAATLIKNEAVRLHKEGISQISFELAKKSVYGKALNAFNTADNIANNLISFAFSCRDLFDYIEEIANASIEDVTERLKNELDINKSSLSVALPIK